MQYLWLYCKNTESNFLEINLRRKSQAAHSTKTYANKTFTFAFALKFVIRRMFPIT